MSDIQNDKVLATISQRQGPFCTRNFTLFPNRLQIEENRLASRFRRYVYLGALKEEPDFVREPLHLLSSLFIVLALVMIALGIEAAKEKSLGPFALVGLLVLIVLFIRKGGAFRSIRTVLVLLYRNDRYGKAFPAIWLKRNCPSEEAVQSFLGTYRKVHLDWQKHLQERSHAGIAASQADALKKFAQLLQDGILAEDEFALVKEKIMGAAKGPIGLRPR